jgi:hypothetical protein
MPIRQRRPDTEDFVDEFQKNVVPSAISNRDFLDWNRIDDKIEYYSTQLDTVSDFKGLSEDEFIKRVAQTIINGKDTREWIDFYFEMIAETGTDYTSAENLLKFYDIQREVDSGETEGAYEIGEVLVEVGLQDVVDNRDLEDYYVGVLVGLETHKRKNRQGESFEGLVEDEVNEITERLKEDGYEVSMDDEYTTQYEDGTGQEKTVDFAIFEEDELRLVVEANCYKGGGSKPSEIRRSYNRVANRMRNDGIAFVWIADGQGWVSSLENVLRQSYEDITDIYNLHQAREELEEDVVNFFETEEV